ncbi:putative oligopeptide transporter, OPT superfamily [Helianthus annuus]|uniref:Oligopeptide transporter, OPT superfamily n=1 Tax=Helianthus annuus TaxID=4232 RepID=A0A251S3X6_HELAN|nr:probable metal-nicotianamine transporter YSL7 [Helianthus annuus]KAF5762537.1 putative oligopeptide transporter, OPT superfamily [Helianthus annuus]KAJ0683629.1 putative oligopeptide transporter, OPT superfamily [Helianthus annuus]KAJ0823657.1 putative oligopeptide transporter, OPT superfamily [Helianthus annuus]KAJ0838390.1 putative oligopeptide transporter, OPT superfamily [Helianthus annuus]
MDRSSSRRDAGSGRAYDDMQTSESDGKGNKTDTGEIETIERIFECKEVPTWQKQLTVRAFVVSFILGILFTFIVMKLNLTTGIIPSLNVSAGLLGFFFVKTWTKFLNKSGMLKQPFTRQENTVIQTCVVATSGIAFSGGFGSYLFGMSEVIAKQSNEDNAAENIKNPSLGWLIGFLFVVSFLGLFSVVPLRKIMIIDFKLIYPSGTATAHLINSFHTPQGAKLAKRQVRTLGKFFTFSFLWGLFQWFFTAGEGCGFSSFPSLGLKAYEHKFYFDFSATYVGVGMICPYLINISLLVGAIISWGLMWPLIDLKKGDWYPADLGPGSLHGIQGYRVFIGIAMILGDGLYNFFKVLGHTFHGLYRQMKGKKSESEIPVSRNSSPELASLSFDDQRRTQLFLKDQIPMWIAIAGYLIIAAISIFILPHIFHQLKRYHIAVIYLLAPTLAFCNAYGCGLTDWSLASTYGKLAIFIIGAWAGGENGGVLAGLAACGVMMNIVSTASDLMQDFKTGYMTLASPRSMFVSQMIGTGMGCIISPCVFWLFYNAFNNFGVPGSTYPAPYALIYRNMAILGVEGFAALPKHCLALCYAFFALAIVINGIRDLVGKAKAKYIPIPMAMAIPFYIGGYFAIDMCVGSLILFVWSKVNKPKAAAFGPAVASGLICGDGIWTLPSSILALVGVRPPICMKFLSRGVNMKVDEFLGS